MIHDDKNFVFPSLFQKIMVAKWRQRGEATVHTRDKKTSERLAGEKARKSLPKS
jgi:hypothetical protein